MKACWQYQRKRRGPDQQEDEQQVQRLEQQVDEGEQ
jgi:hypothetical protein